MTAMAKQFGSASAFKTALEARLRKRSQSMGVPFSTVSNLQHAVDALAPENARLPTRFMGSGFQGHGRGSEYLHRQRSAGVRCPRTVLGRERVRTGANMMPAPIAIQL